MSSLVRLASLARESFSAEAISEDPAGFRLGWHPIEVPPAGYDEPDRDLVFRTGLSIHEALADCAKPEDFREVAVWAAAALRAAGFENWMAMRGSWGGEGDTPHAWVHHVSGLILDVQADRFGDEAVRIGHESERLDEEWSWGSPMLEAGPSSPRREILASWPDPRKVGDLFSSFQPSP